MQTTLMLKERTPAEAEVAFDQHVFLKIHDYLRNECILGPEAIDRVIKSLRDIYTEGMFSMMVMFDLNIADDSAYSPFRGPISQYCRESSTGIMKTVNDAAALAGFHMLKATARHLATLDDLTHRRRPN